MLSFANTTRHRLLNDVLLQDRIRVHFILAFNDALLDEASHKLLVLAGEPLSARLLFLDEF